MRVDTTFFARLCAVIAPILLTACGGGSGGTGAGGGSSPPPSLPPVAVTLTTNATAIALGGNVTVTWSTDATVCNADGGWSGPKSGSGSLLVGPLLQDTTFTLSCEATATASANSVSASVSVTASAVPSPTPTKVVSNSLASSLDLKLIGVTVADMTWDSTHALLWVVTRADSSTSPSSLLAVNPLTGATTSISLGSEPDKVAVSDDGSYVYVGFLQGGLVKQIRATDLTTEFSFSVGAGAVITQIKVSPTSAHTIAIVAAGLDGDPPDLPGLLVADDGIVRPGELHGLMPLPLEPLGDYIFISDVHWSSDGTHIDAIMGAYAPGIVTCAVTPQGVSAESQSTWSVAGPVDYLGGRIYSVTGYVYSQSGPVEELGRMPDALGIWNSRAVSATRGKAFSLEPHLIDGAVEDGTTLYAFDVNTLEYIDSITFDGPAIINGGKIVIWGDDGIAIGGDTLLIARGTFAAAGGIPPPPPATAPILLSHSVPGLSYKQLGITANDLAADTCGHLYAATDAWASPFPSSVIEIDFATGTVLRSVHVTGEPYRLAISDDCSTLYAALNYSNAVARIDLSTMTADAVLPLGVESSGFLALLRGRSVSVAPGHPHTVAIAKGDMDVTLCGGSDDGIVIFDDLAKRPVQYGQGEGTSIKSIAWGANPSVLYGEDWTSVYAFTVDSSGAGNPRSLFPYRVGTAVYDLGRDLYFDPGTARLYNSFGNVFDTSTSRELGPIHLADTPGIVNSCGTPSAARVSDSTSGKVYFVTLVGASGLGVAAYSPTDYRSVGHLILSGGDPGFWEPVRVVRPASSELAVVTTAGQIVLMQGSLLAP